MREPEAHVLQFPFRVEKDWEDQVAGFIPRKYSLNPEAIGNEEES